MIKLYYAGSCGAQGEAFTDKVNFTSILIYDQKGGERPLQEEAESLRCECPFFVLSSEREVDKRLKERAVRGSG